MHFQKMSKVLNIFKTSLIYRSKYYLIQKINLGLHDQTNIVALGLHNRYCTFSKYQKSKKNGIKTAITIEGLKKWIDIYQFEGGIVPHEINDKEYDELLVKFNDNPSQCKNYLRYLLITSNKKMKDIEKKKMEKDMNTEISELKALHDTGHIKYGLWRNSMFSRINKQAINYSQDSKVIKAIQFGQPLIFDCDFDNEMKNRECNSYVKQLIESIQINRLHKDPFHLCMCNQNYDSSLFLELENKYPTLHRPAGPTITSDSYLDRFPHEKLVYLSPNSSTEMKTFDHQAIYIIGSIVDLREKQPLTLAKSKRENLKTVRLPFDRYRKFVGSKTLALNVMIAILLELKVSGDFNKAFDYIPQRLIKQEDRNKLKWGESPWNKQKLGNEPVTEKLAKIKKLFKIEETDGTRKK